MNDADVTLYHFNGWPDLEVPNTEDEMLGFNIFMTALVHLYAQNNSRKAIMHCRQGHGRTGTASLTLTRILQRLNGTHDIISQSDTLLALRLQRNYLCETEWQYEFA